ncbi:recombination-associated protein RdgC [Orbus mooreae]|uniref:recombination-associated protein RdgC n=1 Tax=Orbus mooreae TaxID=3074107 RepID=UPI00370D428C
MFCKNLIVYDINNDTTLQLINNELLQKIAYTPCSPIDSVKSGFISPLDNNELMIEINDQVLLKYQIERKILPGDVIKRVVNDKVEKQEKLLGRKLKKSEKLALKDEAMIELLPSSFSKFEQLNVWIDKANKTLAITASSFRKSEDVLAHLRKELGSLAICPICEQPAEKTLTKWLQGDKPTSFEICDSAVLFDCIDTRSKIKLINEQITDSREVKSYIDAGRMVESLSLSFNQGVKFTIKRDLTLSKITFDPCILLKNDDFMPDEKEQRIEADFILTSSILSELIKEIKTNIN